MSFLTQLNRQSYPEMLELIKKHLAKKGYVHYRGARFTHHTRRSSGLVVPLL